MCFERRWHSEYSIPAALTMKEGHLKGDPRTPQSPEDARYAETVSTFIDSSVTAPEPRKPWICEPRSRSRGAHRGSSPNLSSVGEGFFREELRENTLPDNRLWVLPEAGAGFAFSKCK
jgi:hypothetical protein